MAKQKQNQNQDRDHRAIQRLAEAAGRRSNRRDLIKRGAGLGLATAAAGGLLPAASLAAPSPARRSATSAKQAATLQFYHDKAPWQDLFTEMGQLAGEQIDIGFEPTPYSNTTSYQQVIQSSLPTDDAPDLFTWWSGYRIESLYEADSLLDLTDIWQTAVTAGDLPDSLGTAFEFDAKRYAIPLHVSYWVTFYNKKVFADNSITVPTTWDELMAAAETLKGAGVTPFYANVSEYWPPFIWFEELLIRTDPEFYNALCRGEKSYTDPIAVGVMETWKGMFDNEYFTALDVPMDSNTATMFLNGEFAMMPVGTWFQQQFIDVGMTPGEDYDAFILPNVNPDLTQKVAIVETGALCIPANGQNVEQSKELVSWWVTPETQTVWSDKLGDTPANPKATSENPVLSGVISTIGDESYTLLQRYWENTPPPIVENAVNELARFMLNPDDYQSVLETIEELAAAEWAKRAG